jgi:hypothetical protein
MMLDLLASANIFMPAGILQPTAGFIIVGRQTLNLFLQHSWD